MDKIRIIGGTPLQGNVKISGAKNAALPLMVASLLTDEPLELFNVPHLADIVTMSGLLGQHGASFTLDGEHEKGGHKGEVIILQSDNIHTFEAPYDIVRKMRASVLVLGPLLARFGEANVSLPGGCAIGTRPINIHLQAFEKMGAEITLEGGYIKASCPGRLQGAEIRFDFASVGATENILMAATLAQGTTVIENAAREPEIVDLAECLRKMGAQIEGDGSSTITIEGKDTLHGASHGVVADRIEAGSFIAAAALSGGTLMLEGALASTMGSTLEAFEQAGVPVEVLENGLRVTPVEELKNIHVKTAPHPGFPTDMQAQFMALMTLAKGSSTFEETIFENRFMHVSELCRLGANIDISGNHATVHGVEKLTGAEIMATDLRASISLVIAALAAEGETLINRVYHIDRGYERVEEKLRACGAHIERVKG